MGARAFSQAVGAAARWWKYQRLWAAKGLEHPATQAAFGRYIAAKGHVFQRQEGPAFVAWSRASGNDPGRLNRRHRKYLAQLKA